MTKTITLPDTGESIQSYQNSYLNEETFRIMKSTENTFRAGINDSL